MAVDKEVSDIRIESLHIALDLQKAWLELVGSLGIKPKEDSLNVAGVIGAARDIERYIRGMPNA